ncbi:hypothetical protein J6590_006192 [Homalodisca vitripennis]|nr:hypothetical protein J6590_006192 [Homalodisca vitripennis]
MIQKLFMEHAVSNRIITSSGDWRVAALEVRGLYPDPIYRWESLSREGAISLSKSYQKCAREGI